MGQAEMRESSAWSRISFFTTGKKIKYEISENCEIKLMAPKVFACLQSLVATEVGGLKPQF